MLKTLNEALQDHGLIMRGNKIQVIYRNYFEVWLGLFHM